MLRKLRNQFVYERERELEIICHLGYSLWFADTEGEPGLADVSVFVPDFPPTTESFPILLVCLLLGDHMVLIHCSI